MSAARDMTKRALIEALQRSEAAIVALHHTLRQREDARGMARPSFDQAWSDGSAGFVELGNWLDNEIDRLAFPKQTDGAS